MGTTYCQGQAQADNTCSQLQTAVQSQHNRPMFTKPPQPQKLARLSYNDDDIETLRTSTHRSRRLLKGKRSYKRLNRKRNSSDTVENVLISALKGISNSLSVKKERSRRNTLGRKSFGSACKGSLLKEVSHSIERMSAKKLGDFLKKQKDFVEKRRKSIDKIRKLMQVQYQKENPHRPSLNQMTNSITKGRIPMLKRPESMVLKLRNQQQQYGLICSSQALPKYQPIPSPLKTYMTFSSSPCVPQTYSSQQLLTQLSTCLSKLMVSPQQSISYLLFVNVMRQMHMVTQPNSVDSGVFVAERELLHKAWTWITKSEDINANCDVGRLKGFVLAVFALGGKTNVEGSPDKMRRDDEHQIVTLSEEEVGNVCKDFHQFRATRHRIVGFIRETNAKQDITKKQTVTTDQNKKRDSKPPKKSIVARKWIQQPKQLQKLQNKTQKSQPSQRSQQKAIIPIIVAEPNIPVPVQKPQPNPYLQTFQPNSNKTSDSEFLNRTILQIDIELGGRSQTIRVSQGDDPNTVASNFIKQFGLPLALQDRLSMLISTGLAKVRQQEQQE